MRFSLLAEIRDRLARWLGLRRVPATAKRRLRLIKSRYCLAIDPEQVGFLSYLILDDERFERLCRLDWDSVRRVIQQAWEEYQQSQSRLNAMGSYRCRRSVVFLDRASYLTGYRYVRSSGAVRGLNRYYSVEASPAEWRRVLLMEWDRVLELRRQGMLAQWIRNRFGGGDSDGCAGAV